MCWASYYRFQEERIYKLEGMERFIYIVVEEGHMVKYNPQISAFELAVTLVE